MHKNSGIKIFFVFGFIFLLQITSYAQLSVEPDIGGEWAVTKTLSDDEQPFEGTLQICDDGKAIYLVHSNQLVIYMTVKQQALKNNEVLTLFYMDYADVGRGYSTFNGFPKKGTLLMKAEWTQEYELTMQIMQPAFVKKLRGVTNVKDTTIFPKHFYKNTYAGAVDCN